MDTIEYQATNQTIYWLFFIIAVLAIYIISCSAGNGQCQNKQTKSPVINSPVLKSPEVQIVDNIQIGLDQIVDISGDKSRFKYEYRLWPERQFQDPDNYAFFSMYGWRVNPPYEYPQKTINTVYNKAIQNCRCWPEEGNESCLSKCRLDALVSAGFPSIFSK